MFPSRRQQRQLQNKTNQIKSNQNQTKSPSPNQTISTTTVSPPFCHKLTKGNEDTILKKKYQQTTSKLYEKNLNVRPFHLKDTQKETLVSSVLTMVACSEK